MQDRISFCQSKKKKRKIRENDQKKSTVIGSCKIIFLAGNNLLSQSVHLSKLPIVTSPN